MIASFFSKLNEIADALLAWKEMIDLDTQLKNVREEHSLEFESDNVCFYCKTEIDLDDKVMDHNHFTGKYNGPAHSECNLLARAPKTVPVLFHNIKYDLGVILPLIGSNQAYGGCYSWRVSAIGTSYTCAAAGKMEFKDTYKLLPLPLAELARQLDPADCILQTRYNIKCSDSQGKGIYPYQWMDSVTKFANTTFPVYSDFYKSFRDYHLFYLKSDVLILADAPVKFTAMMENVTGMWIPRCVSLPQCSYAGLWRENKIEVPHITDAAMYETCKGACKGGLNIVAKRVTKVTDSMKQHIKYFDIKSMYPKAMSEPLPVGNFEWVEHPSVETLLNLCGSIDLTKKGAIVTIGVLFPVDTHDNLRDFPPLYEKRIFLPERYPRQYPFYEKKQTVAKLIAHLGPSDNYTCTIQELLIITNLGGKITSVTSIVTYNVEPFCASYIEKLRKLRQGAIAKGNTSLSLFVKLLMNSIYGMIYQDESKYLDIKIITTIEEFNKVAKSPLFKSAIFNERNVITTQRKKTYHKKALVATAAHILGLSKASFLFMWYFQLKPAMMKPTILTPEPNIEICYIDTDSMIVLFTMHVADLVKVLKKLVHLFDFSNLPKSHVLYNTNNIDNIGVFKDEVGGKIITEVYASSAKCYTVIFKDDLMQIKVQRSANIRPKNFQYIHVPRKCITYKC